MITAFRGQYKFLSNFHPCKIGYESLLYGSAEAAYQAAKVLSLAERNKFTTYDAATAKRMGRLLQIREDWPQVRLPVMMDIVMIKFADPTLATLLIATDDEELVEGNSWHDEYWGVCNCELHRKGENHLGKILMQVREYYRNFE